MRKKSLLSLVAERVVIFDGAMGTMLLESGLPAGGTPELWNLERPDIVEDIHRRYFAAGSDVVQTNTFGGTALKLADKGSGDKAEAVNAAAVKIAKRACPEGCFVAGDIGPTGRMLPPVGTATVEELEETFFHQAAVLLKNGADLISIETMFSLEESLAAVRAAKRAGSCPVIAAVTYNKTPNGYFTMMGEGVGQCVQAFEDSGADVIASNCTLGSRDMLELVVEMKSTTEKPILIQPNAGKPIADDGGPTRYEQTAQEFAEDVRRLVDAGADMVGGCCGTNASFIREMVRQIRS
ncbi:MAG: homocysteine S-methyltransferase family protein [Deltaproteobacteria bacterium]|nr:homocysteine S-methyltransferase family protein [Deltaproteobacteria bacterium]